jgi:lipopolysaccharide biosynthesis glycosyltransferase
MKTAVFTITIGDFYKQLSEVTHPTIKNYAKKIGADFLVCDETTLPFPHYEKFEIAKLLETYDRVLYLDSDILVSPNTPNIFDVVPENKMGMLDESVLGYDREFRKFLTEHAPELVSGWEKHKKCYNAGVIVCSKEHKNIFKLPDNFVNHYFEQSYLNLRLLEEKAEIFDLPIQYNRMIYLDLVTPEHRLKSYIIHYAGFLEKRPIEECKKFLEKEYKMLLSQDFSEDDVKIAWANV